MPSLFGYQLFVSHAWHRSEDYNRVLEFLNSANNFSYKNFSVPETDPISAKSSQILSESIRRQIRPVTVVIILAGIYVSHSDWIQFEIDYAKSLGKPILGIKPWGQVNMPYAVTENSNEIVGWNGQSIVEAIRRLSN